ncbi:MAG: outer membrane protein assembly factor BamB [Gammaproteobacteria bacterium]|nr:MAG: outer membrane protein assembly factor BamB [Gammaproteobacteria bacterium]
MKRQQFRLYISGLAMFVLSGCAAIGDYLIGTDNAEPPAPLPVITELIRPAILWSSQAGSGADKQYVQLVPAVDNGKLFVADRKGRVYAYDALTGNKLWEKETGVPLAAGPGTGDGLVLVGSSEGDVVALKEDDGSEAWRVKVTSEVLAIPRASAGISVVRSVDGRLFGFSSDSGKRRWVYDRTMPILTLRGSSSPVLTAGVVITGFDSGRLAVLTLDHGLPIWDKTIAFPRGRSELERLVDIDADPVIVNGVIYVTSYQGGVVALDLESGRSLWSRELSSYAGISVDASNVYVTDANSLVWALDRRTGKEVWKQEKLRARSLTGPVAYKDYVVAGDFEGYLHWMSKADGRFVARTRIDDQGIITSPIVRNDILYAYGKSGQVQALKP